MLASISVKIKDEWGIRKIQKYDIQIVLFYLFIYFLGANKMEHSLTDGEEQQGSIIYF